MRGGDYPGMADQWGFSRWLFDENVQGHTGDAALVQSFQKGLFIYDSAPGNVDEPDAGFHDGNLGFTYEAFSHVRHGDVDGDEVGSLIQLFQRSEVQA